MKVLYHSIISESYGKLGPLLNSICYIISFSVCSVCTVIVKPSLLSVDYLCPVSLSELQLGDASFLAGNGGCGLLQLLGFLFPDRSDVLGNSDGIRGSTGQPSSREPDRVQSPVSLPPARERRFQVSVLVKELVLLRKMKQQPGQFNCPQ